MQYVDRLGDLAQPQEGRGAGQSRAGVARGVDDGVRSYGVRGVEHRTVRGKFALVIPMKNDIVFAQISEAAVDGFEQHIGRSEPEESHFNNDSSIERVTGLSSCLSERHIPPDQTTICRSNMTPFLSNVSVTVLHPSGRGSPY